MTRDDAHNRLHFGNKLDYMSFNDLHNWIEEIFDYFESRTCENCKYFLIHDKSKVSGSCKKRQSIAYTMQEALYGDDGCNKWRDKDERD